MGDSVSVAMATYQGATFLNEQLESLAAQTVLPRELVVCDDRSTDGTREIVEEFARRAPFPVTFRCNAERLHFADNFLRAASLTSGSHVAFCDQDDVWEPEKIATVLDTVAATGAVLVAHDASVIDENGERCGELVHWQAPGLMGGEALMPWHFFFGFTCTVQRRLLDLLPAADRPRDLMDPRHLLAHDRWVAFLASVTGEVYLLPDRLARYRQHRGNASTWMRSARGGRATLNAARTRFGYNIVKQVEAARTLVALLDGLLPDLDTLDRPERVVTMRDHWATFEHRSAERYRVATADRRADRARNLVRAVFGHAYRHPVRGTLDIRMLARDLVVAMVARPGQQGDAERLRAQALG